MKNSIIIIVLLLFSSNIIGQQYWSKTFEVHQGTEQVWQLTVLDSVILMGAISVCSGFDDLCYILVKLDLDGHIQIFNKLHEVGYWFYTTANPGISLDEQSLILSFSSDYYVDTLLSYLAYLDKDKLTIDSVKVSHPLLYNLYNVQGHIALSNMSTLEYGQEYNTITKKSLTALHYRDAHGKKLWERTIGNQFSYNGISGNPIEMTSNKIAGISMSCTGCEYPTMKPYVFAVDTFGDLVFDLYLDTMISDINRGQRPLIAPYDSTSFVMVWYQQDESGFDNNPYIARIGQDGTIFWRLVLPLLHPSTDVRYIHQLIRAKNGDYILAGERFANHIMSGSGLLDVGCAMRISPEGEVIWDRVYHEPEVKYPRRQFFWNVAEDEDENLYFSGEVQDSVVNEISNDRNTNFWLVKVCPDGCIDPGCTEQVIILPTQQPFRILPEDYLRVYPNPVRDMLQVSWEELPGGEAFLSAHDISGRLLGTWPVTQASGTVSLDVRPWPGRVVFLSLRSDHWMTLPVKVVRE